MKEEINKIDPALLMGRAKEGDEEAFGLVYEAYFSPVYRYIYFRVQDKTTAEDLTQMVFLKVLERLPLYKEMNRPPLAYFFTIARNKITDHWRANKRLKVLESEDDLSKIPDSAIGAEEIMIRAGTSEVLSRALEKLPSEQREAIILKFINELSYGEIAKILKKSEEAVRQIQCRALKNLRKYYQEQYE